MSSRIVKIENLKGLAWKCPDCGNQMTATGELEYNEGIDQWLVNFWCPTDEWFVPYWSVDLDPLIKDLTKDLDPSTLPIKE